MRTEHPHVERRRGVCGGEPVIRGTRFPVRAIVEIAYHQGMAPEEMIREWKELTLAAIHDALSYYHDHRETVDRLIRRNRDAATPKRVSG